jgi:N-acetylglucosaminyldiphosphoundecaprenol N-acetyl-beta-D-mannosaminyltransferase
VSSLRFAFIAAIQSGRSIVCYGFSLHSVYSLKYIPEIIQLGKEADIVLTDGQPFFWLCRMHGLKIPESISIPDSVNHVIDIANENGFSVMLVGARKEVNDRAASKIREKYSNISMLPGIDGYFSENRTEEIIREINNHSPDILLVGMSSPKKEKFVFLNKDKINARVIIPCGGMIDIYAGLTKQTPKWLKKMGLATLYRIIQEPRRLLWDRLKMLVFIFGNFLPLLLINGLFFKRRLSLIDFYTRN